MGMDSTDIDERQRRFEEKFKELETLLYNECKENERRDRSLAIITLGQVHRYATLAFVFEQQQYRRQAVSADNATAQIQA